MNIITGYIVKEVLKGSLITMIILLTLVNAFTFRDELKHLGEGAYGLKEIIWYVALTSPTTFYELMPSAALLGSMFVLSSLEKNRELVAMRISGLSVMALIRSVLIAGSIMVFFAIMIGEFIAPEGQRAAKLLRSDAQLEHQKVVWQSLYGLWLRDNNMFINVRQIKKDGILSEVNIYELNGEDQLVRMTHAHEAIYQGKDIWLLRGIRGTNVEPERLVSFELPSYDWKSSIDPDLLKIVVVKSDNLSLYDLAVYIQFLKENNQKAQTYELAFWGRVVNPFITLVMLMIATPFVMGFSRAQNTGPRMLIGVLIGLCFNVVDKIVGNVGLVYEFNPALVAILPSALVLSIAFWAIHRIR